MRGFALDDLEVHAEAACRGVGAGAGLGVAVDGDDGGSGAGRLDGEGAAAAADVPHQVSDARAQTGELGRPEQICLTFAELTAVGLGGEGPAAGDRGRVAAA